jgi:hypothetical protein
MYPPPHACILLLIQQANAELLEEQAKLKLKLADAQVQAQVMKP